MSLNVVDVSSGQSITLLLKDGGMETIDSLIPIIVDDARRLNGGLPGDTDLTVTKVMVGQKEVHQWEKTVDYYMLEGEPWFVKVEAKRIIATEDKGTVLVAGMIEPEGGGRKTIPVDVTGNTTLGELMKMVKKKTGVDVRHDRKLLYRADKSERWSYCVDPCSCIAELGCSTGDIIQCCHIQTGGGYGFEFADLSNRRGLQTRRWSESAPPWRVAHHGLCIEGECKTPKCPARSHRVIANLGFTDFDVVEDQHKCCCPICRKCVIPTTCGFNNCRWKWVGKKIDQCTHGPVVLRSEWNTAGDTYNYFDEEISGKVSWIRLMITTEHSDMVNTPTCAMCLDIVMCPQQAKLLPCRHNFHRKCVNEHKRCENVVCPQCPVCQAKSAMTPLMKQIAGL